MTGPISLTYWESSFASHASLTFMEEWLRTNAGCVRYAALERLRTRPASRVILEPRPELVLQIWKASYGATRDTSSCVESIGFPFPVYSRSGMSADSRLAHFEVQIFWCGRSLQEFQRQSLQTSLRGARVDFCWNETDGVQFAATAVQLMGAPFDYLYFNDPFRFVGDSVYHLLTYRAFQHVISCEYRLLTTQNKALDGFEDLRYIPIRTTGALIRQALNGRKVAGVIPVYIDDQWKTAVSLLGALLSLDAEITLFVPGPNLLMHRSSRVSALTVWHACTPDVTVREFPYPDLAKQGAAVFGVEPSIECLVSVVPGRARQDAIVICPCSREQWKTLPSQVVASFLHELSARPGASPDAKVLIPVMERVPEHGRWLASLRDIVGDSTTFTPVEVNCISELDEVLMQAAFVLTADTASVHLARRRNTPQVVVYNRNYWDPESMTSLTHHSYMGFGYYSSTQMCCSSAWEPRSSRCLEEVGSNLHACYRFLRKPESFTRTLQNLLTAGRSLIDALEHCNTPELIQAYSQALSDFERRECDHAWIARFLPASELLPLIDSAAGGGGEVDREVARRFVRVSPFYKAVSIAVRSCGTPGATSTLHVDW